MAIFSSGYRFTNRDELEFYHWLMKVLGKDTPILHNFFVYDAFYERFREIDFGIIYPTGFLILEHKRSCEVASGEAEKWKNVEWRINEHLKSRKCPSPRIACKLICKYGPCQEGIVRISSQGDTEREFGEKRISLNGRTKITPKIQNQIVDSLDCVKFQFNPIRKSEIFSKFDEFSKWQEKLREEETPEFWAQKLSNIYAHFRSFDYILCSVFMKLDEQCVKEGKDPALNYFRPSPDQLQKLRPTYWGCATSSEDPEYASYVQLSFHISRGPWQYEKGPDTDHIAVGLSFFRGIRPELLRRIQRKIAKEKERFTHLLRELKDKDSEFVFYRSLENRYRRKIVGHFPDNAEKIANEIVGYDRDEDSLPLPRSTAFMKFMDWDDISVNFIDPQKAIEFLCDEFRKLLPLYFFLTEE